MLQITVKVSGMMCGMCEAHINDAVRSALPVKKVTSSRVKGETVLLAEEEIPDERIRFVIDGTGYTAGEITRCTPAKKGFFSVLKKRGRGMIR